MPRSPSLDNFSVAPTGFDAPQITAPAVENAGLRQQGQLAQSVSGASDAFAAIALDRQREANQLRVDDAINRAKEQATRLTFDKDLGFTAKKGIDALERPNGTTLTDEYSEQLGKTLSELGAGLGNEAQRQAFQKSGRGLMAGFRQDLIRHEASEFQTYAQSVDEGRIANAQNDMGLFYDDPERIDNAALSIRASVDRQRRVLGKSAEWGEAQTRELLSEGHMTALSAALEKNDIGYAERYLDEYKSQMTAKDLLRVDGIITKEKDAQVALSAADEVFGIAQPSNPNPSQFALPVRGQETSPFGVRVAPKAGASTSHSGVDIAVPKGTAVTAPAAGKVVAVFDDPKGGKQIKIDHGNGVITGYAHLSEQNVAVGDAVVAGQTFAKSGDSGNVTGPHLHYTMRVNGRPVDPTKPQKTGAPAVPKGASLLDMIAALGGNPALAGHPERLQAAEQRVRSLYAAREEGERKAKDDTRDAAFQALYANGGDMSRLSPGLRAGLGDDISAAYGFAKSMQAANKPDFEPDLGTWTDLKLNPDKLAKLSPSQVTALLPRLGTQLYKDIVTDRTAMEKGDTAQQNGLQVLRQGMQYIDTELRAADIDTSPKPGSPEATKLVQFRSAYIRNLQAETTATGKAPTPERARQIGLGLLNEQIVGNGWFGSKKTARGYEIDNGNRPARENIPPAVAQQLTTMLRRTLPKGTPVTQGMVRDEYARFVAAQGGM